MIFKNIENKKIHQLVIQQIKDLIYSGELKKGDKLPTVNKLQKSLGVSRSSIREAFSALELIGIIETTTGEGTYISNNKDNTKFIEPLSLILALEEDIIEELLEFRLILECASVKFAVARATDEELKLMKHYNDILEESKGNEESCIKADMMFHYTIGKASKNKVLYQVLTSISEVMNLHIINARNRMISDTLSMKKLLNQHKAIYNAISNRNEDEAIYAIQRHLSFLKENINEEK